ncbi:MAG: hypothetical protein OEM02_03595 [Desulfobulbaceae bacterium]|nr:hypothetical protein [Desulfobulbaceae bacterium]
MNELILVPQPAEIDGDDHVRRCSVIRRDNGVNLSEKELWFRLPCSIALPDDSDCDSYLLAVFMDALKEGRRIVVHGSVSGALLSNLVEYQSVWHKWLPDIYRVVDIQVDRVREGVCPAAGAISAFSGGVDATFTVWRHSQKKWSYRSQDIKLSAFVHGFDIPLTNGDAFASAFARARETLRDLNIELFPIATNCKEISCVSWEHYFVSALVSVLINFKRVAGVCLIGSGGDYNGFVIPLGSSPMTDYLLGSEEFIVMHDGASHNRTEKVKEISEWRKGVDNLRVCWEGELKDRNCGKCEKCLRTKLNFLASGGAVPDCLAGGDMAFSTIRLKNTSQYKELKSICHEARKNGVQGAWLAEVEKVLKDYAADHIPYSTKSLFMALAKRIKRKLLLV